MSSAHSDAAGLDHLPALLQQLARAAREEILLAPIEASAELPSDRIFGSNTLDLDLPMDRALKERMRTEVHRLVSGHWLRRLTMEGESKPEILAPEGAVDLLIDPLDGSLCFHKRSRTLGLPYSLVVTAMPVRPRPTIGDTLAGLVVDLRNGDTYLALRHGDRIQSSFNSLPVHTDPTATCFDGQHIYFFDTFYPETRELLQQVAGPAEGWFRNPGGAGYEMVSVGSGLAALFCSTHQKMHELGAAWLFNTGAGAVATTLTNLPLATVPYDFEAQIGMAFFATESLRQEFFRRLARASPSLP